MYFGGNTAQAVDAYLDSQGTDHGYAERVLPVVFVKTYQPDAAPAPWWHAEHACTHLQFHIVLATAARRGVFAAKKEGEAVADRWSEMQHEERFALRKVSFVPDHVHIALWLHPAVAPAAVVVVLMNEAQRLLAERFAGELVGASLGAFGNRVRTSAATAIWRRRKCRPTFAAGRHRTSRQPNDPRHRFAKPRRIITTPPHPGFGGARGPFELLP